MGVYELDGREVTKWFISQEVCHGFALRDSDVL
jgi:hypothetical protein